MRLLNTATNTINLKDFTGKDRPTYAILSHTWEEEEVTFQDLKQDADQKSFLSLVVPHDDPRLTQAPLYIRKKGYSKIKQCCQEARKNGYDYVWIDTCCIDKSSSAELSEAINSMFRWYQEADICYTYLSDVSPAKDSKDSINWLEFEASRWFTRGWTLQELLAPKEVIFYANDWTYIDKKSNLYGKISSVTGIDIRALRSRPSHLPPTHLDIEYRSIYDFSIAQRMSWASKRETTRLEDIAYCLMGIFNINMPLLYGEGTKAFSRLQNEILDKSEDDSIFVHCYPVGTKNLLADSPQGFEVGGSIVAHVQIHKNRMAAPYYMTNRGLCIELYLAPCIVEGKEYWMAGLHCIDTSRPGPIRIFLEKLKGQEDLYHKVNLGQALTTFDENSPGWVELKNSERKKVYIMLTDNNRQWEDYDTVVNREHVRSS